METEITIWHRVDAGGLFQEFDFRNEQAIVVKKYSYTDTFEPATHLEDLERVFARNNRHDSHVVGWEIVPRGSRSLSVGDIVQVGEQAWSVSRVGWAPVDTTEFREAIDRGRDLPASTDYVEVQECS